MTINKFNTGWNEEPNQEINLPEKAMQLNQVDKDLIKKNKTPEQSIMQFQQPEIDIPSNIPSKYINELYGIDKLLNISYINKNYGNLYYLDFDYNSVESSKDSIPELKMMKKEKYVKLNKKIISCNFDKDLEYELLKLHGPSVSKELLSVLYNEYEKESLINILKIIINIGKRNASEKINEQLNWIQKCWKKIIPTYKEKFYIDLKGTKEDINNKLKIKILLYQNRIFKDNRRSNEINIFISNIDIINHMGLQDKNLNNLFNVYLKCLGQLSYNVTVYYTSILKDDEFIIAAAPVNQLDDKLALIINSNIEIFSTSIPVGTDDKNRMSMLSYFNIVEPSENTYKNYYYFKLKVKK